MKPHLFSLRFIPTLLCLIVFLGVEGPAGLTPSAEAASSKRGVVKRLNNRIRKLKRQLEIARRTDPFIEMVAVGNPRNRTDAGNTGQPNARGAVNFNYHIGKYEVTNAQYAAFLNAVASTDAKGLYHANMGGTVWGGIARIGAPGSFTYDTKPFMANKPVIYVSFWNACRFCNWLHNGRLKGMQDAGTTEDGAYDLVSDPNAIANNTVTRKNGAKYFLPSEDQWYKAAYHQPQSQGGDNDDYWDYPTRSNTLPGMATSDAAGNIDNDNGNIANYFNGAIWNGETGNLTTVGSAETSRSFYGAYDMGGNVWEWNEEIIDSSHRGARAGSWGSFMGRLKSSFRVETFASDLEDVSVGFRVASP